MSEILAFKGAAPEFRSPVVSVADFRPVGGRRDFYEYVRGSELGGLGVFGFVRLKVIFHFLVADIRL